MAMITFDVRDRWTGEVQFTAEIGCAADAPRSMKLGLAVRWGIKAGADLTGANLTGAKWREGVTINRQPLQIYGLDYPVTILDVHMQIGCELHSLSDWATFDSARIIAMDGKRAAKFWTAHKVALLALAESDGRGVAQAVEAA